MLSPDYLKALGEQIERMYASLEDDIIADIARRLVSTKFQITQSAVWQAEVLETTGVLRRDIINRVARATKENERVIEDLFEEGGLETLRYDNEVYKRAGLKPISIKQSPAMMQIIIASAKRCNNELKNLTRTSAATGSTEFRRILDKAYMQVISGGFDYNTAIRRAVKEAGKAGIKVVYPSGGTAQLDVAIRRAVVTGVNQNAGKVQEMHMEEMGTELVETSAHFGARPDHAEWQGQVFYYKEPVEGYESFVEVTRYGSGDGLMGWNCRHSFFPFFKGSKRAYTDEELKEMKEHTVKYNGKEYTDYKASQIQRRMEREIRATKREILAIDKARNAEGISQELKDGLNSDYNLTSVVLARKNEQLADFLEQTGRGEDRARLQVDGFDRSHAQASVWAARKNTPQNNEAMNLKIKQRRNRSADTKQYEKYKALLGAENVPETFDKFVEMKYNDGNEYVDLKHLYREVSWQKQSLNNRTELRKLPNVHIANSVVDKYIDGKPNQRRYYGKTGKPRLDIDLTDHGNPKEHGVVPHYHNWNLKDELKDKWKRDLEHDKALEKWHIIANKDILEL